MTVDVTHVAVAVIYNSQQQILITKRHAHVHQGGLWEFPGGKLEPGETIEQALSREIQEELGIEVKSSQPLIKIRHDYPDKAVLLDVWQVTSFDGTPVAKEEQPMRWIASDELNAVEFPEANHAIINAVQLPEKIMITGEFDSMDELLLRTSIAIKNSINHIHFRAHWLNDNQYLEYARELLHFCRSKNVKLVLSRGLSILESINPDGVHLTNLQLTRLQRRPETSVLISASCHNRDDIIHCHETGLNYCFLSPVKYTASHSDQAGIGWRQFESDINGIPLPVYALGGMLDSDLKESKRSGGRGIAAISAFWG